MKAHTGVNVKSGYVHSLVVTSANVHDVTVASQLLRANDHVVYGDSGYIGLEKREEIYRHETFSKIDYRINKRYGHVRQSSKVQEWEKHIEKRKSIVRSKVEHPFLLIKRYFGYTKARYHGLYKNLQRLLTLFASANMLMCLRAGRKLSV